MVGWVRLAAREAVIPGSMDPLLDLLGLEVALEYRAVIGAEAAKLEVQIECLLLRFFYERKYKPEDINISNE